MQDEEQPCKRENIVAVVEAFQHWSVDKSGRLNEQLEFISSGEIMEYWCTNCQDFFTPRKRHDNTTRDKAWKEALGHLESKQEQTV